MYDYCKHVDVFYGNGEVTEFADKGIASKWFFIKALCGNTTPHAVLPFGKMSVGAYSGGYPTGYGTHHPNSCGGIRKLSDKMLVRGFSHIHESGTGAIDYYYNYAVTTPFYGDLSEIAIFRDVCDEKGKPGLYSVHFNDTDVSLTATHHVAFHRYAFGKSGGRVAIDFSNDGLYKTFDSQYFGFAKEASMQTDGKSTVFFKGILSGVMLYFCAKAEGKNVRTKLFENLSETDEKSLSPEDTTKLFGCVFDFDGDALEVKVSYSTLGFREAEAHIDAVTDDFETVSKTAYETWNRYLSSVQIDTDDEVLKGKFYSNFYHSLIKPAILTGENVLGVKDETVVDFNTFWDQYKTLLPLLSLLYHDEAQKIANGIVNISRTFGKIPCSFGLTEMIPCEKQAKMLGVISLCDAYYNGYVDKSILDECIRRELSREDYKDFHENGYFERYTHILDVTDGCLDVADITDDEALRAELLKVAEKWTNAYGRDGLMSEDSPYYEGDRYTYSFRLQNNMHERVALAGGKEKFAKLLDDFFGYGKESVEQVTTTENPKLLINERMCHRFEGFNNECDMETPFAYIFADRHDRICEITKAAVHDSYRTGTTGIPGNNDSGGMSSCFVWLALGLFPWVGTGKMLLGCPQVDRAVLKLQNGKTLTIETERQSDSDTVREIRRNGEKISGYVLALSDILQGGTLTFVF